MKQSGLVLVLPEVSSNKDLIFQSEETFLFDHTMERERVFFPLNIKGIFLKVFCVRVVIYIFFVTF